MTDSEAMHFLLRITRLGPLVPARLWLCDHDPADAENRLDRGNLSIYPRAEISGREADPDLILDRIGIWQRRGDGRLSPHEVVAALADPSQRTPRPVGHWAYAQPIGEAEYRYRVAHREWTARHKPDDPTVYPRKQIDPSQLPLPIFEKESTA